MLCLGVMRAAGKRVFDDALLRSRVGDKPVSRLGAWRAVGVVMVMIIVPVAWFIPPVIPNLAARHVLILAMLAMFVLALAVMAVVEFRFRGLLIQAGMLKAG